MDPIDLDWNELESIESEWIELDWIESEWIGLSEFQESDSSNHPAGYLRTNHHLRIGSKPGFDEFL